MDLKDYRNTFPHRLHECRMKGNMSQRMLADFVGLSHGYIAALETGKRYPSFKTLCILADHFVVSIDYLIGRSDDPKRY